MSLDHDYMTNMLLQPRLISLLERLVVALQHLTSGHAMLHARSDQQLSDVPVVPDG
jgi:hypothetical protein